MKTGYLYSGIYCKLDRNRWVSLILLRFARPQCLAATHLSSPEVGNGLSWPKPHCTCNAMVTSQTQHCTNEGAVMLTRTWGSRPRPRTWVSRPRPRPRTWASRPRRRPRSWLKSLSQGQGLEDRSLRTGKDQGQGHITGLPALPSLTLLLVCPRGPSWAQSFSLFTPRLYRPSQMLMVSCNNNMPMTPNSTSLYPPKL